MGKIDKWNYAALLMAIAILLVFFGVKNSKSDLFYSGLFSTFAAGLVGYLAFNSKSKIVENRFNGKIFIKPENDSAPIELKPLQTVENLDGISSPSMPGMIFKLSNGMFSIITETGSIKIISPISNILNAGWKKRTDFKPEDLKNWEPLFQASEKK